MSMEKDCAQAQDRHRPCRKEEGLPPLVMMKLRRKILHHVKLRRKILHHVKLRRQSVHLHRLNQFLLRHQNQVHLRHANLRHQKVNSRRIQRL